MNSLELTIDAIKAAQEKTNELHLGDLFKDVAAINNIQLVDKDHQEELFWGKGSAIDDNLIS